MPEEQRIHFWTDTNVPINIKERLSGQLIEVYIQLDNLVKFVELNHDGFRSGKAIPGGGGERGAEGDCRVGRRL